MSELEDAEVAERTLREQLADLVRARARAESEAGRLDARAGLTGAQAEMGALAERYRTQAGRLETEIADLRAALRGQEAAVERLRAEEGAV